ncbi:MAG: isocitrate lyase/PEP mutase family protein [Cyanobacteria bacterium P01_E01_bin.42]
MLQCRKLRQLLQQLGILTLPGVYDCISAKLAEEVGFEAVFTSGFGISGATLGLPDYGFLTATEVLGSVGRMAEAIAIPLVADLDTGYGNPLNVIRTVRNAVKLGIAGIILEDQEWPKKCGHFEGKRVIALEEQVEKIRAAIYARQESGLVIVARTDARANLGLEEAIRRGRAYIEAGADILFIEAPQSVAELEAIAAAFPDVPLFANAIEGGKTPILSSDRLAELGFKIVVYPLAGLFAATHAMRACFQQLREQKTTVEFKEMVSFNEFKNLIGVPEYQQLEQQFKAKIERDHE